MKGYKYIPNALQISRLKYIHETNKWIGIENEKCESSIHNQKTVVLNYDWVQKNFNKQTIIEMKNYSMNNNKFLRVPVGDFIKIKPTMNILLNPIINFKNNNKGICAFASLSSTLHYLGYLDLADIIFNLISNTHIDFNKDHLNIIQSLNNFILRNDRFKNFRKKYFHIKLGNNCDILDLIIKKQEILIVALKQTDNHQSHAVCICNGYIFASNTTHALPFSLEGLNCCCGEKDNFVGIVNGYHIKLRLT